MAWMGNGKNVKILFYGDMGFLEGDEMENDL
jgi:hypothetical protein